MKFSTAFDLRIKHEYYDNGRCPDFVVEAQSDTRGLLKNYRCILKSLPDGIRMLTATNEAGKAFISLPEVLRLRFYLRIDNPDFALFTDLSDISKLTAALYTNAEPNPDKPNELLPVSKKAFQKEQFNIVTPGLEEYFTLGFQPLEGIGIDEFKIEGPEHLALKKFDATDKRIAIDSESAQAGEGFSVIYPVKPRLPTGVFAEAALHYNIVQHPPGDEPVEFQIAFKARQAKWKYYLITDQKKPVDDYHIKTNEVSSEAPAPHFSDENRRDLKLAPDPLDAVAGDLAQMFPQWQLFRFISDDPIPCRQSPRKSLQLHMNENPIVGTLPNPSVRNLSEIIIQAGAIQQKQNALYQVIKYLTQPF